MRVVDSDNFELECVCGAMEQHPIADAVALGRVKCRSCGCQMPLSDRQCALLDELLEMAAGVVRPQAR
jgi:hypothetical protein